ncbi:GDSL esterase/lipase [Acorus gramineus]|uniref:GDSL esterase/lipase n=1 Tax=Acorus gramineus TaxID=55184 RepID=A0AAV9AQN5_ACOGR|nr:GDSL esterase/lipase [Acorus gramineus]
MAVALNIVSVILALYANTCTCAVVQFIFGDSLSDVGNNNYLTKSLARAALPWYGIDFGSGMPNGRFSNGRTVADIIGDRMGYPRPPAFLDASLTEDVILEKGVNYASGGGGILNETASLFIQRFSLYKQIELFQGTQEIIQMKIGGEAADKFFKEAIYTVALGSNDFINNYLLPVYPDSLSYSSDGFIDYLMSTLESQLKLLHSLGVRKLIFVGLGPMGCIPILRVLSTSGACQESTNKLALSFNQAAGKLMEDLNVKLPNASFRFGEAYDVVQDIINDPAKYGFKNSDSPCCTLMKGRIRPSLTCTPLSSLCKDRSKYVFWDEYHPTDAANELIATVTMEKLGLVPDKVASFLSVFIFDEVPPVVLDDHETSEICEWEELPIECVISYGCYRVPLITCETETVIDNPKSVFIEEDIDMLSAVESDNDEVLKEDVCHDIPVEDTVSYGHYQVPSVVYEPDIGFEDQRNELGMESGDKEEFVDYKFENFETYESSALVWSSRSLDFEGAVEDESEEDMTDEFQKEYIERMSWFDLLYYDRRGLLSAISGNSESSSFAIPLTPWIGEPIRKLIQSVERDFEMIYVGQLCLGWEALHYQYRKVESLAAEKGAFFGNVAGKFQKFQIFLERFAENDKCDGRRVWNYVHNRSSFKSLLQVPEVSDNKNKSFWKLKNLPWTYSKVQDPRDLVLLSNLNKALKKRRIDMVGGLIYEEGVRYEGYAEEEKMVINEKSLN